MAVELRRIIRNRIVWALSLVALALTAVPFVVRAVDEPAGSASAIPQSTEVTESCSNGTVVPSPDSNEGLVSDCKALMAGKDTLRGTATLNWDYDLAITSWHGVTVSGSPQRVTGLKLPLLARAASPRSWDPSPG